MFSRGVKLFRDGQYESAVESFSQALGSGEDKLKIYDSRAAAYQKLNKLKDALRDAKAAIDLQPERWQGYARSARVFLQARKYDAARRMVELALERIPTDLNRRRDEMVQLQEEIAAAESALAKAISKRTYHFGKLPVEIATAMFSIVLEDNHAYVVTLAQVCKNWRSTILDTPSFWTTLVLGRHRPKRKVQLWRERSRDRIRELVMLETFTDHMSTRNELHLLSMDTLRAIRVDGQDPAWLLLDMPNLTPHVFASLHRVALRGPEHRQSLALIGEPAYDWRVLKLAHFFIADFYVLVNRLSMLESFSLAACQCSQDWVDLLWLLARNPYLTHLEIIKSTEFRDDTADENPMGEDLPALITMPGLTDINIDDTSDLANVCLPRLVAPSLTSLRISLHRQRLGACFSWLASGPASTLTTLSIQRSTLDVQLLLDILPAAVALESLQLTYAHGVAPPILTALATPLEAAVADKQPADGPESSVRRVRCPSLRHLDVSYCPDVKVSPIIGLLKLRITEAQPLDPAADDAVEVAKDAWPPVRKLESLVIDGCPDVDADTLPWLRAAVPSVSCVFLTKKKAKWRR